MADKQIKFPDEDSSGSEIDNFSDEDYYCELEQEFEEEEVEVEEHSISGSIESDHAQKLKDAQQAMLMYHIVTCNDEKHRQQRLNIPGNDPQPEIWECQPDPCEIFTEDVGSKMPAGGIVLDTIRTQLAYGDVALARLKNELEGEDTDVKLIAAIMLADFLHDPEHIEKVYQAGIIESVRQRFYDESPAIREKAADCFRIIANHPVGRSALLKVNGIGALAKLLLDDEEKVKINAHKAMERLAESNDGAHGIVRADLVPDLLKCMLTESEVIQNVVLDTLHFCLIVDTTAALQAGAMVMFRELLNHTSNSIRWKAARAIFDLSVTLEGKQEACITDTLFPLISMLEDPDKCVRAKAAGAIMMITITTRGKDIAIKSQAMDPLLVLLEDPKFEVRINALKALTNMAEDPEGRLYLLDQLEKIEQCLKDRNPSVQNAAKIAIKVIQWTP